MINECGAAGKMRIGRRNLRTRRESAPVPLCLQTLQEPSWDENRAPVIGSLSYGTTQCDDVDFSRDQQPIRENINFQPEM